MGLHLAALVAKAGSPCLYKDSGHILAVRLVRVVVTQDEVFLTLKPFAAPGLPATVSRAFRIGGQADWMTFCQHHVSSGLLNYQLLTEAQDVARLMRFAAGEPGTDALLRAWRQALKAGRLPSRRSA